MSDETTTPAERVNRYRAEYADRPWTIHDSLEAYQAAMGATIPNALDAIEQDAAAEALAWATLASVVSFRYRKAF